MSFPLRLKSVGDTGQPDYRIESVDAAQRQVRLSISNAPRFITTSEAHAVLVPMVDETPTHVVPVEVTEIFEDGSLVATFRQGAAEVLKPGPVLLFRPFKGNMNPAALAGDREQTIATVATASLRALPSTIRVSQKKPAAGQNPLQASQIAAHRTRSTNNIKQILLALFNYESAYGHFPPAVIYGPDGKPWHSWRTLILPFLEQVELYKQYDFTKPWDAPENRKVVETVLPVYLDPIYGDTKSPHTHYAVLVGEKALYKPQGARITDPANPLANQSQGGRKLAEITDGTSNTLHVVPVAADRKIPWAKPEDITVGPDFPGLGKPGGIAAPYPDSSGPGRTAPAGRVDGSVFTLRDSIPTDVLLKIISPSGGEVISADEFSAPQPASPFPAMPILAIRKAPDGSYSATVE
jgi:hypothetical protein